MKRPIPDPAELPAFFRNLLAWGECYCAIMDGGTCLSCANAKRIGRAGLNWSDDIARGPSETRDSVALQIWLNAPDIAKY
jgi:hypothetical protein